MEKITVGIVGYGFVGKAIASGFSTQNVVLVDPILSTSVQDLYETKPDVVFVCVPTPMGKDGKIDSSIVEKVFEEMSDLDTLMVLKSTVTPDIAERLSEKYKWFVYNPEFLTEANARNDFENPHMQVFGGCDINCHELERIYRDYSSCAPCVSKFMTAKEASFLKYSVNCYLATRVVFWNQMKELMDYHGANYDVVRDAFGEDPRIGSSHSMVPGPDGRKGTSGPCFGKDVPAFIKFGSGDDLTILKTAWNANVDYRNSYAEPLPREKEQNIVFEKIL